MKINLATLLVPFLIGFVLGTAGITWTDWQLHVVLILAGTGHFIGYQQGRTAGLDVGSEVIQKIKGGRR